MLAPEHASLLRVQIPQCARSMSHSGEQLGGVLTKLEPQVLICANFLYLRQYWTPVLYVVTVLEGVKIEGGTVRCSASSQLPQACA
jgi:hypothetical protein